MLQLGAVSRPPQRSRRDANTIAFSSDGRLLVSGCGSLAVGSSGNDGSVAPKANALTHFYVLGEWLMYASYEVLWLPRDCRFPQVRMHNNKLAWT